PSTSPSTTPTTPSSDHNPQEEFYPYSHWHSSLRDDTEPRRRSSLLRKLASSSVNEPPPSPTESQAPARKDSLLKRFASSASHRSNRSTVSEMPIKVRKEAKKSRF